MRLAHENSITALKAKAEERILGLEIEKFENERKLEVEMQAAVKQVAQNGYHLCHSKFRS